MGSPSLLGILAAGAASISHRQPKGIPWSGIRTLRTANPVSAFGRNDAALAAHGLPASLDRRERSASAASPTCAPLLTPIYRRLHWSLR
jgi:hypothetical protein